MKLERLEKNYKKLKRFEENVLFSLEIIHTHGQGTQKSRKKMGRSLTFMKHNCTNNQSFSFLSLNRSIII